MCGRIKEATREISYVVINLIPVCNTHMLITLLVQILTIFYLLVWEIKRYPIHLYDILVINTQAMHNLLISHLDQSKVAAKHQITCVASM